MLSVWWGTFVLVHASAVAGAVVPLAGFCAGFCATCACHSGTCMGAGGFAAGGAGAAGAAGGAAGGDGSDKPRKVFPLPGGGWFGSDGRVHYGAEGSVTVSAGGVEVGSAKGSASADFGAAPGSDPHGDIVNLNWNVSGSVDAGPLHGSAGASGSVGVQISPQVQQNVSAGYGGLTQSGRWAAQFAASNE